MFIPASALLAMHSIYIGQLVQPAAAPLIMCMCVHLGGVAIIYYYLHPAFQCIEMGYLEVGWVLQLKWLLHMKWGLHCACILPASSYNTDSVHNHEVVTLLKEGTSFEMGISLCWQHSACILLELCTN